MRSRGWRLQWLAVAALVAAGLAAIGVAQTAAGRSVLRSAGLAGSPPRYTELAFANPGRLPYELLQSRGRVRAGVLVHNMEGSTRLYRWRAVEERPARGTVKLDSGRVQVAPEGWARIGPRLRVICAGSERVHIRIALDNPPRSVGFWIECPRGLAHDAARQPARSGVP